MIYDFSHLRIVPDVPCAEDNVQFFAIYLFTVLSVLIGGYTALASLKHFARIFKLVLGYL